MKLNAYFFLNACDGHNAGKGTGPIRIETPRLILRELEPADAARIHELTTKPGFYYYCFDGSRKKVDEFLQEAVRTRKPDPKTGMRDNHMLGIVLKDTGQLVGHVCLERMHYIPGNNYEINFFVDPDFQSKGYGREAAVNMMHFGFKDVGLYAYTVTIDPKNAPSQRVARTEGYKKIADITIETVKGTEARDLFILTEDMFWEQRKLDRRPLILGLEGNDNNKGAQPPSLAP